MKPNGFASIITFIAAALLFGACSILNIGQQDSPEEAVIGKVDGGEITFAELRSSFFISPLQEEQDPEEIKEEMMAFLDMYLIYRARVAAAKAEGYFEDEDVLRELNQYQKQSVFPYWLEMRFREELLDELVARSKTEVGTSHILISVSADASPADTLAAWNQLMEARDIFLDPEDDTDFNTLAERFSTRQRGQSMGGDLGFISGGWAVKPFEDVAFSTQPGEVSMPFRTSFGYHIVHVYEVRETVPDRSYSHIYFRTRGGENTPESAMERAEKAFTQLQEGQPWDDVTLAFSEDPDTRQSGGNIGWIQPARFQPQFLENINRLSEQGEWSEPFESEYGIHIARLDSIRTYQNEEQLREELYERLRNLPRYRENRSFTLQNVRQSAGEVFHEESFALFEQKLNETENRHIASVALSSENRALPLYDIHDRTFTLGEFYDYLMQQLNGTGEGPFSYGMIEDFKQFAAEEVIVDVTKAEFPDFADLSNRYHEGLAVFRLVEGQVWNYAAQDTTRLKEIFEANRDNYRFGTRYRYYRISADTEERLHEAQEVIRHGVAIEEVREAVSGLILRTDMINNLSDFPFDHLQGLEAGDFTEIFEYRNRPSMLYLAEIKEPRRMTFEEAFMRVSADFQPIREQEWNAYLSERFQVTAFPERLREVLENTNVIQ
ncbi:peptidyl-prolyl cis-trans isomerase SurA [Cyclonatronum proteinivorum]|uniref:Peptidyl-prolyl cis-trans isomerase SurA n=1 Tax=Cyclonatronum proteinivorum TaxID=1457365 RepID=A0A345UK89_9BACT|nr:peptidylprolyl isomerase [Cyclonatronum proteinivorum]AXJ00891.1 peptidyl-prolyl cis-trans isomerase SurA [Cyclonatronum proteinivorum]